MFNITQSNTSNTSVPIKANETVPKNTTFPFRFPFELPSNKTEPEHIKPIRNDTILDLQAEAEKLKKQERIKKEFDADKHKD